MVLPQRIMVQVPLIEIVESDDVYLQQQQDLVWFAVLRDLDWVPLRPVAAAYYAALYQHHEDQAQARAERAANGPQPPNPETKREATQRLLFERATLDDEAPALYTPPAPSPPLRLDPCQLRPGTTPARLAGRAPKCFFALFKAFIGLPLRGRAPEPENVHDELKDNPAYARTCGFTLKDPTKGYRQSDVPELRTLEQFDQLMTQHGLWNQAAVAQVKRNLEAGRIQVEGDIVHDTTHYQAFSTMQVVAVEDKLSPQATTTNATTTNATTTNATTNQVATTAAATTAVTPKATTPPAGSRDSNGKRAQQRKAADTKVSPPKKPPRKSHPRTTKFCRCPEPDRCPHPWRNADEGAGTVVKSGGKKYWAHKASTLGFPGQHILLDAVAMSDAASHDSTSLVPHLQRLFEGFPELLDTTYRVLDDGAADDAKLKAAVRDNWGVELLAPINPRRRSPLTHDLPRGIDHLTPMGTPVCRQGFPFELQGSRYDRGSFSFRAPNDAAGVPVCQGCPVRTECYRGDHGARQITIPHQRLPWLDPKFPQLSKRFAHAMAQRTAIERLHKLMKDDYGDHELSKRGNDAFQARLDKTKLAMHLVIAHDP